MKLKVFATAALLGATVNAATEDISAVLELFRDFNTFMTDWDFWKYFFMELQFDTNASYSTCI